jgi:capsule polysaccharide modification protein KpsS
MLARFRGKHVLLLQGPAGPFFRQVARALVRRGARVSKINLNPGDVLFFPGPNATSYRGTFEDWPAFFETFVRDNRVDAVMLFGDCRPHHRVALARARELGLTTHVFEEGYVRPHYLTLEEGGVNGNSRLPRDPEFYRSAVVPRVPRPKPVGNTFWWAAAKALAHAIACTLFWWVFPHYRHHRDVNVIRQTPLWWRGGRTKLRRRRHDREVDAAIRGTLAGKYFLVPLQVQNDSQLTHSRFQTVAEFIELTVRSFAAHAPPDTSLLVKHHPFDRPYQDYTAQLGRLAAELGLGERLIYADSIHLPTAIENARGALLINSTVGLSSVLYGTPTKCLGKAIYDMPGLTHQGPLDDFWKHPGSVDRALARRFRAYVIVTTQVNGSVWTKVHSWRKPRASKRRRADLSDRIEDRRPATRQRLESAERTA